MNIILYEEYEEIILDEIAKQILINTGLGVGISDKKYLILIIYYEYIN